MIKLQLSLFSKFSFDDLCLGYCTSLWCKRRPSKRNEIFARYWCKILKKYR